MFLLKRSMGISVVILTLVIVSGSCLAMGKCSPGWSSAKEDGVSSSKLSGGSGSGGLNSINVNESKEAAVISNKLTTTTEQTTTTEKEVKKVTVFTSNNHNGRSHTITFEGNECQNFPGGIKNRVLSVDTYGNCITLCDNFDCGGWCLNFKPGSPAHNKFRKIRFHNRAESARAC